MTTIVLQTLAFLGCISIVTVGAIIFETWYLQKMIGDLNELENDEEEE